VLASLDRTDVRHPRPVAVCENHDVIGAPFFVVEPVDGVVYHTMPADVSYLVDQMVASLISELALLHQAGWKTIGLADLGRPDHFTQRQVGRWYRQYHQYGGRDVPALTELASRLESNVPREARVPCLLHGDYGFHNVMFSRNWPGQVAAVLDWEMSTIGNPLADLGYLLAGWIEPGELDDWGEFGFFSLPFGLPPRALVADRYQAATGLEFDEDELAWFRALGRFKIAVILEGAFTRHIHGYGDDPYFAELEERVPHLARHGLAILNGRA